MVNPFAALATQLGNQHTHPTQVTGATETARPSGLDTVNSPTANRPVDYAAKPGEINKALGYDTNAMGQQPADGKGNPIIQGQTVAPTNNQDNDVAVLPGEQKPGVTNPAGNGANTIAGNGANANGANNNGPGNGHGNGNAFGHMHGNGQGNANGIENGFGNGNVALNVGGGTASWMAPATLMQSSFSAAFAAGFTALYFSEAEALRASFSHAVRRNNSHNSHHPTQQQQPSQLLAETFNNLNRQNMLALTASPINARGPSGPTALMNEADRETFTRMLAASMREFSARPSSGLDTHMDSRTLHPQSVLTAFGLMHADQLGPEWLAHGTSQLITLAQGAGPQEADTILEALALALLLSALTTLRSPTNVRSELALAQTFAAMQLISQMQDPDAFAQMFSRLGSGERQQLLTLLASLSPNVKLAGLDELDPISLLLKAFAARSGEARLGEGQRGAGLRADVGENLGTLLSARSAAGMGARGDAVATDKLRAELLQFVAAQPTSFYFAERANQKNFHSGRLEAVLQLIVQQLLRELAAKAGRLSKLRCDFADSIELLSNLLDLLTQRDDEDSEHSRRGQNEEADEGEESETDIDIAGTGFAARAHFGDRLHRVEPRGGMTAEYSCQTLFRVVPDQITPSKVAFRWEKLERNPLTDLPSHLTPKSPAEVELKQLQRYASASSVVSPTDTEPDASLESYELLAELLMPNDAAYALGASAAGMSIMAKHWHCKMWAHDFTYRLSAEELANHGGENTRSGDNASKRTFDFGAYVQQHSVPLNDNDGTSLNAAPGADLKPLRSETAMRHDLLRMLENSQDRWVREQASRALQTGLQKLKANGESSLETKGEVVRRLRSPVLRDCTIYFLSRYYFTLNTRDAVH
jgi:hypothetical protein